MAEDVYATARHTAAEEALAQSEVLANACMESPQAFVLPYRRSKSQTFIIVWPYIIPEQMSQQTVWRVCSECIQMLDRKNLLAVHEGVEVVPSIGNDRVLRLSVATVDIPVLSDLGRGVLSIREFGTSSYCQWY